MNITCDFHLHSGFSGDSDTPMEEMVRSAVSLGLKVICFTEHLDLDYPAGYGDFSLDLPRYFSELSRLRDQYQEKIDIRFGIELGMQPHLSARYARIISDWPFDFIIASQHLINGRDPYFPEFWEEQEERAVYGAYFRELLSNLKTMPDYDTAAHLDYIVRYGPGKNRFYSYEDYADDIDPILQYLIAQQKCLEVNTAGLKYGLGHPNPEESVLRRYRELGGERITIGSDGHKPEHIAYDFGKAADILKELGFGHYTVFRQRRPSEILL